MTGSRMRFEAVLVECDQETELERLFGLAGVTLAEALDQGLPAEDFGLLGGDRGADRAAQADEEAR
jgi:hypothetical protein